MKSLSKALAGFPRARIIHLPTPFEAMPRFASAMGLVTDSAQFFVKRDDCTGLAMGGNKTRKLQYVVAQAIEAGADTLITTGGIQSNHARQTAGFAAKLGLNCELVLQHALPDPPEEYMNSGNLLLDQLLGAKIHLPEPDPAAGGDAVENLGGEAQMEAVASQVRECGGRPFIVALGASTPTGALGYVECAMEIVEQSTARGLHINWVVMACGSAGTQAGLIAGFKALGVNTRVIGIAVSGEDQAARTALVKSLAQETLELLGRDETIVDDDVIVNGDYVGEGYGYFDDRVIGNVCRIARSEALIIDPVYTGKAMTGMVDLSEREFFKPSDNVVFLHTGGAPGLFAYSKRLRDFPSFGALEQWRPS